MILQDDFKQQILPLARIKKIMKLDEDVKVCVKYFILNHNVNILTSIYIYIYMSSIYFDMFLFISSLKLEDIHMLLQLLHMSYVKLMFEVKLFQGEIIKTLSKLSIHL